jgi:hypothetical protein
LRALDVNCWSEENDQMNYNNKKFKPISNTGNSEASSETIFIYKQVDNNILTADYKVEKL